MKTLMPVISCLFLQIVSSELVSRTDRNPQQRAKSQLASSEEEAGVHPSGAGARGAIPSTSTDNQAHNAQPYNVTIDRKDTQLFSNFDQSNSGMRSPAGRTGKAMYDRREDAEVVANKMMGTEPGQRSGRRNRRNRHRIRIQRQRTTTAMPPNWPANCTSTQCQMREAHKHFRLKSIREDILSKLRLSAPPNISRQQLPHIPQIQTLLHSLEGRPAPHHHESVDDFHATTLKVINFAQPVANNPSADTRSGGQVATHTLMLRHNTVPPRLGSNQPDTCYFTFQEEVRHSQIITAHLGVYIRQAFSPVSTIILVYKRGGNAPDQLIGNRRIHLNAADTEKWYHFDIKTTIEEWIEDPTNNNYGLRIIANDHTGQSIAIVTPSANNQTETLYKPYVVVRIQGQSNSRPRRMLSLECDEFSTEENCCRYPLEVDFEQFGWDWIIAPKRYRAYYCAGECPFVFLPRYPHTHLLHMTSPPKGSAGPCCSPSKMSPISMLYFDETYNIVFGTLPAMVVDRCGCS